MNASAGDRVRMDREEIGMIINRRRNIDQKEIER